MHIMYQQTQLTDFMSEKAVVPPPIKRKRSASQSSSSDDKPLVQPVKPAAKKPKLEETPPPIQVLAAADVEVKSKSKPKERTHKSRVPVTQVCTKEERDRATTMVSKVHVSNLADSSLAYVCVSFAIPVKAHGIDEEAASTLMRFEAMNEKLAKRGIATSVDFVMQPLPKPVIVPGSVAEKRSAQTLLPVSYLAQTIRRMNKLNMTKEIVYVPMWNDVHEMQRILTRNSKQTLFGTLPAEVLLALFCHINDFVDWRSCKRVCKTWRAVAMDPAAINSVVASEKRRVFKDYNKSTFIQALCKDLNSEVHSSTFCSPTRGRPKDGRKKVMSTCTKCKVYHKHSIYGQLKRSVTDVPGNLKRAYDRLAFHLLAIKLYEESLEKQRDLAVLHNNKQLQAICTVELAETPKRMAMEELDKYIRDICDKFLDSRKSSEREYRLRLTVIFGALCSLLSLLCKDSEQATYYFIIEKARRNRLLQPRQYPFMHSDSYKHI